jgi:hypothetical protein
MTDLEQRYAELEAAGEAKRRAKARRQPLVLMALVNALVLGTGVTAMVDLRRLQTPQGTALRWVQAAVFGDCEDYLTFSTPDGTAPDARSRNQLCADLRAATAKARNDRLRIGLRLGPVVERGSAAQVQLVLTRHEVDTDLHVQLRKDRGRWLVLRDPVTCGSVGCA